MAPAKIGHEYIDTAGKHIYKAVGNSLVTDWVKVA
jgi:hypothetical protein